MISTWGESLKLTIFGRSHGPSIGMTLAGIPTGLPVDLEQLQHFLDRRAPGKSALTTPRREADVPQFQEGLANGITTGGPITAVIENQDVRSTDYDRFRNVPRPGHADYTARIKYGQEADLSGGGHLSGRLTAPLCIAGGLCKQWLEAKGIVVEARLSSVGCETDPARFTTQIQAALDAGDSVGGTVSCVVTGLPVGLGDPHFGGMENRIAQIIFGIPGIKGIEFGSGFAGSCQRGSETNDAFQVENGRITTKTNHCGGILGGISNGMPLTFRVAVKPTPSIARPQESVSLTKMEPETLEIRGRHDPCIALRAVPVVEACGAIAIYDALLSCKGELLWMN